MTMKWNLLTNNLSISDTSISVFSISIQVSRGRLYDILKKRSKFTANINTSDQFTYWVETAFMRACTVIP